MPTTAQHARLQAAFAQLAAGRGPGVFARITQDGEEVFSAAAGTADTAAPRPITADDRFRIASVTKTYLAAVVLQLAAEGRLALTDTVEQWTPGLVPGGDTISVDQLLRMVSGLPDYAWAVLGDPPDIGRLQRTFTPEELVRTSLARPDRREPGRAWRYSNTDYVLLGLITEAATGRTLQEAFQERIFDPLGLGRTYLPTSERHLRGAHTRGYLRLDAESGYADTTEFTPSESWASGAIVSTPPEVARFLDALLGGSLLPAASLAAMRTTQPARSDMEYGMGLFSYRLPGGTVLYGHGGSHFGVDCYAFRSDRGRTAVIYQNSWDRVTRGIPPQNPLVHAAFADS
ncbi:beta-lactamase family protein [Streptacidiphilus sp. PB12-B1b]|uniref:serine hydrolase domain-containing protein n=1 Tax=Streptacidiphilus sp. PB12-B1b TaxID=2705012 RepID=UPI0015F92B52|nr:serine hydrolase domain-containing protein [Streptacidiphilus sp. PB12-B1b]QMU76072.1 beta-lactamase family protein [Streptacidiphilus sp. PB12-B1b]